MGYCKKNIKSNVENLRQGFVCILTSILISANLSYLDNSCRFLRFFSSF